MKKAFLVLLALAFFLVFRPVFAQESWVIESFDSVISIPQNGKVQVVETVTVDFGLTSKHGIFRSIPTEGVRFDLKSVKQDGAKAVTDVSSSGGTTTIRIGDPDRRCLEKPVYEISYERGKVITSFDDHDEFYWNVTGSDWEVSIRSATATVALEEGAIERVICFTGYLGSQESNCTAAVSAGQGKFAITQALSSGEGFTITNSLPKHLVAEPFYLDDFIRPYWLILGSLAAGADGIRRWLKHGRDMWYGNHVMLEPDAAAETKPLFSQNTAGAEVDPPDKLRPGEGGTLVDERVDLTRSEEG